MNLKGNNSFTLIELLIVIGIIAIISVVVIVVLNPQELIKQARDSTRFSDMTVLERSLSIFEVDRSTSFAGTSTVVYVSVPDTSSTCANLGLPSLPSGWTYNCASTSTLQNVDGTGWIPANLTSISTGSPLDRLPIDPTNATSTGLYYTYVTGGSFELTSGLEAEKYGSRGDKDRTTTDGGTSISAYEKGNDLALTPTSIEEFRRDSSLVGYWTFDDGSGTTASDASGNGNTGTVSGSPVWETSSNCKLRSCLDLDGLDDYVALSTQDYDNLPAMSLVAWINLDTGNPQIISKRGGASNATGWQFKLVPTNTNISLSVGFDVTSLSVTGPILADDKWYHVAATWTGSSLASNVHIYVDGSEVSYSSTANGEATRNNDDPWDVFIGTQSNLSGFFNGTIDDVRIYDRALSASEVQALYNSTK